MRVYVLLKSTVWAPAIVVICLGSLTALMLWLLRKRFKLAKLLVCAAAKVVKGHLSIVVMTMSGQYGVEQRFLPH